MDGRKIGLVGKVTIMNGDRVICVKKHNAITRNGMRHIQGCIANYGVQIGFTGGNTSASGYAYMASYDAYARFGKGNAATTKLTDALVSLISVAPATFGNSIGTNFSMTTYVFTKYAMQWAAGAFVSSLAEGESLGEIGLYLRCFDDQTAGRLYGAQGTTAYTFNAYLFARLGLEDDAFVPDPTLPVVVEWELGIGFI